MTTHERIKQKRKEIGLTAEQVASALGVSRATVYRYESADIEKLPIDIIVPLANVLQTTPSYLMGWDESLLEDDGLRMAGGFIFGPLATLIRHFEKLDAEDRNQAINFITYLSKSDKYVDENQLTTDDLEPTE